MKTFRTVILTLAITVTTFLSVSFINSDFEISKNLDIFATLYRQLNTNYVDEINPGELMKTGIDAMLESLDPYTNFITESDIEDYKFMTTGQYGGIGAMIHQQGDYVIVSEPYKGYSAYKANLMAGDKILKINGENAKGKTTDEISTILKGQAGTPIQFLIERPGTAAPLEKTVTREIIQIASIPYKGMIDKDIAYINLNSFTQNCAKEMKDALLALKDSNQVKGLIIDLRNNGGGLLNEAIDIANLFVDKNEVVVKTKAKLKSNSITYTTKNNPIEKQLPVVILVNEYSASASEIVAGAMQDLDRAVIIGQKTFGKGLVQSVIPLSYNNQLKVTISKYYIPSGRCIQALDYSHKDENGKANKLADSLLTAFKTKNGRTVYDAGGITPDIKITQTPPSQIAMHLVKNYLIFDFATQYKLKNPALGDIKSFKISDKVFTEFVQFLSEKAYSYTTKTEEKLAELKEISTEERYFDKVTTEYELLKKKLVENKKNDLMEHKEEIKDLLVKEIVSRYYYQEGRIQVSLYQDEEVKKAIDILKDQQKYASILGQKQ